ncbi:uncharacterized protein LOC129601146 [Paramacrobiotus metropolitanus]|uniref:uncharacterized protein LOC129601146 n=1 Tax=Paramacrobiotus metropolitanus TaxID=2943436 RepID=UPI002445EF53|nr:uncharacterized protein LOC129601146 [Paramacrobiotus metropolitanus]
MSWEKPSVRAFPSQERLSRKRLLDSDTSHRVSAWSGIPQLRTQSVIRFAPSQIHTQCTNQYAQSESSPRTSESVPSSRSDSPPTSSTSTDIQPFSLRSGRFSSPSNLGPRSGKLMRLSDPAGLARDSMEILGSSLPSHFVHSLHSPFSVDKYWEVVRARNSVLEKVIAGVTAAYEAAYGDQIAALSAFMISALRDGLVPHQPQATPSRWLKLLAAFIQNTVERLATFASLLTGFHDLSHDDQRTLLVEKHLISYVMHYASYFHKGEYYYMFPGADGLHLSKYVLDSLEIDPDYVRFVDSFYASINSIGLTLPELYLLLAAAIFYPEITKASNKTLMGYLHVLYMDALNYSIGKRLNVADRAVVCAKVQRIVARFPLIDAISVNYVQNLNVSSVPLRSRTLGFRDSFPK